MITQDQLKDFERRINELHGYLKIEEKRIEVQEDDLKSQDPNFWDKPKEAEAVMKRMRGKKFWIDAYDSLKSELEDIKVLMEFYAAGEATEDEITETFNASFTKLEEHWVAGDVREVYSVAKAPVLALTRSEPQGVVNQLIVCLQK